MRTGGPPALVGELAAALGPLGVSTTIASTDQAEPASSRRRTAITGDDLPPGAEQAELRLFPTRRPFRIAYAPDLNRYLDQKIAAFDALHLHTLYLYPQFAAYRHALRRGVPYVVSFHGALHPALRRRGRLRKAFTNLLWQDRMLAHAAAIHVTSRAEAATVADVARRVPRAIIPNIVRPSSPMSRADVDEFRKQHLGGDFGPIVLSLGRISRRKNLDVLVRAFGQVARGRRDARLVIAGPDDEGIGVELLGLARTMGVQSSVVFTGMLTGRAKSAAFAASSVFVNTSRAESFAISLIEAMAAGVPPVLAKTLDLASEIGENGAGMVVDLSPAAFANAIDVFLGDNVQREAIAARARTFASSFEPQAVAPSFLDLYRSIAADGRAG
jgi:glycosyltransferase involved in cell wall biosynthesis